MTLQRPESMSGYDATVLGYFAGRPEIYSDTDPKMMETMSCDFVRAIADVLIHPETSQQPFEILLYAARYLDCTAHAEKRKILTSRIEATDPLQAAHLRRESTILYQKEHRNVEMDQCARRLALAAPRLPFIEIASINL